MPAVYLDCRMRMYGAVIIMDSQLVTVWVINWIKLSTIYNENKFVKYGTVVFCVIALAGQFQYVFQTSPSYDSLGHCSSAIIAPAEIGNQKSD
ncbi:hypothetical protein HK096_006830, partial [Nowakowskiella sp. JEL0078]